MNRLLSTAALLALLAGCGDGQPFEFDDDTQGGGGADDGVDGDDATAGDSMFRSETENQQGGGYVTDVSYDAASDTFTVDNLAFDGENVYQRKNDLPSLGGYALYESDEAVIDPDTGRTVRQLDYRAIYGESINRVGKAGDRKPRSRFAIVRTGDYLNYGFGGFVYERNGGVDLPDNGQAVFTGDYAGMRIFTNGSGLEYTRGDMEVTVDFEDFDDGEGVRGRLTNRLVFDSSGNPVPTGGTGQLLTPTVFFDVVPGVLDENGEIRGTLQSTIVDDNGDRVAYESGQFYGIVGGEAEEIVGILVMESDDPRATGVTAQETGGFIVYR